VIAFDDADMDLEGAGVIGRAVQVDSIKTRVESAYGFRA
jgi:hypothetical protein